MSYHFKLNQEALWFVGVAVASVLAQELLTFDGNAVTDWRVWAVALASACVRAAAGAVLAWIGRESLAEQTDPVDDLATLIAGLTAADRERLLINLERRQSSLVTPPRGA